MKAIPSEMVERLYRSTSVAVLTGPGVPEFRGTDGNWKNGDPLELASVAAFSKDPKIVWEWYESRRRQVSGADPNGAHEVLAWMETFFPKFSLITQNVDRLHQKAGSRDPLELHGSLWMTRCTGGCGEWEDRHELKDLPPKCPHCGALLRPGVVWSGENLPPGAWARAEEVVGECDALLVIGTSALVAPAALLPEEPLKRGKLVIEIDPEETPLSPRVTLSVRSKVVEVLLELREDLTRLAGEKNP